MRVIARGFLVGVGTLAVILAVIGIFVPVLPTTPFLLLAAFCYARSSERFHQWLMSNRWFGPYLRNYREGGGMILRDKVLTVTALWLGIGSTVAFVVPAPIGRATLLLIACVVTVHLLRIKTLLSSVPSAAPSAVAEPLVPDQE